MWTRTKDPEKISVTRGNGFLEEFLARQRAKMADQQIPKHLRNGSIADIGCGNYPFFLLNTEFKRKYGLDKVTNASSFSQHSGKNVVILNYDVESRDDPPIPRNFFDVITMLAVIEHIKDEIVPLILRQIYSALRNGGVFILTTPAPWTNQLLKALAFMGLVSKEEIAEHKATYKLSNIFKLLQQAGFKEDDIHGGYFELGMNLWIKADKD